VLIVPAMQHGCRANLYWAVCVCVSLPSLALSFPACFETEQSTVEALFFAKNLSLVFNFARSVLWLSAKLQLQK